MHVVIKSLIILLIFINVNSIVLENPPVPEINAGSALLVDLDTNKTLYEKEIHEQLPIASVTKVMTALVVFEKLNDGTLALEEKVLISEKAWRMTGSRTFLELGSLVSIDDLLKGLIVQSGNDAAIALAEHIAGEEVLFADLMNEYAKKIGMKNSNFKNPHGLTEREHYSTAYDLSILGRYIIQNHYEYYRNYFNMKSFLFNNINQNNRNRLIHTNPHFDGFKTGYTVASGYTYLGSARLGERRVIVVILKANSSEERFSNAEMISKYGLNFFDNYSVNTNGKLKIPAELMEYDFLNIELKNSFIITLPKNLQKNIKIEANIKEKITEPLKKGDKVGNIIFLLNNKIIEEIDVIASHDINQSTGLKYWVDYFITNIWN